MSPPSELPGIPVATREQSGVLCFLPICKMGAMITPTLWALERIKQAGYLAQSKRLLNVFIFQIILSLALCRELSCKGD